MDKRHLSIEPEVLVQNRRLIDHSLPFAGQTPNYRINLEDMVESDEEPNRRTENNRNAIPLIELSSVEDDEL